MALLFDEDYEYLQSCGLAFQEDEARRFFVIKNYPLPKGIYHNGGSEITETEVLIIIPENYNTTGNDMLWTYPLLLRKDGKAIPNTSEVGGGDPRHHEGKEYCRWSRHFPAESWKPKLDNVVKLLGRIEWAFQNPDANIP